MEEGAKQLKLERGSPLLAIFLTWCMPGNPAVPDVNSLPPPPLPPLHRIKTHENICQNTKERKVFNVAEQRVQGTEAEDLIKSGKSRGPTKCRWMARVRGSIYAGACVVRKQEDPTNIARVGGLSCPVTRAGAKNSERKK